MKMSGCALCSEGFLVGRACCGRLGGPLLSTQPFLEKRRLADL